MRWKAGEQSAGYSSPIHVRARGIDQVVVFTARTVASLEAKRGELLWEYPWRTSYDVNAATPLAFHARKREERLTYVLISSGYNTGCALLEFEGSGQQGFEARSAFVSNELECHFSTPIRYQDHLYALDERRQLTCLALRTGEVKWRKQGFQKGTLIRADGHLLVLGERGDLALVEATPEEYREVASARVLRSQRCWTLPALADGRLFVRDQDQVKCLELRRGRP